MSHTFSATNPAQMRLEIRKLVYSNPIVQGCFQLARQHGLSERDFLTILAYTSLEALHNTQLHYMAELAMGTPSINVVVPS